MPVNWGLGLSNPNAAQDIMGAYKQGQQERQEQDGQNALTAYATDPNEANLNGLARFQPQYVIQQKQQQAAAQQKAQADRLLGDALANPDPQARAQARQQLAYVNHEEYQKLGEAQKKQVDAGMDAIAQQAFSILQMPKDQQGPALQQVLQAMQSNGVDVSGVDLSKGPEFALKSALAMSGKLEAWEKFAQPDYTPVGEGGVVGFQFGKPMQQGGQVQNFGPPAPQGVTFTPLDDGGPTQPASGNFRP